MFGFYVTLLVGGAVLVLAVIAIALKLQTHRMHHRKAMEDLVRGRTGSAAPHANKTFSTKSQMSEVELIEQLRSIARRGRGTARKAQAAEDAMLRRAERMHQQMLDEAARDNRGPRSRPSGPCTLQIDYVDGDGVWTTRRIAPYKSGNTNDRFDAWCETRQERRTFLFERVQSGVDLRTGRPLDRAGVFRHIHPGRRVPGDLR